MYIRLYISRYCDNLELALQVITRECVKHRTAEGA